MGVEQVERSVAFGEQSAFHPLLMALLSFYLIVPLSSWSLALIFVLFIICLLLRLLSQFLLLKIHSTIALLVQDLLDGLVESLRVGPISMVRREDEVTRWRVIQHLQKSLGIGLVAHQFGVPQVDPAQLMGSGSTVRP